MTIAETFTTAPKTFEPIFARKPNGDIDARSMVRGLLCCNAAETIGVGSAARHPRHKPRSVVAHPAPLRRRSGAPNARPAKKGPATEEFLRIAYNDIPAVVEEMRQYWMPTRFRTRS